MTSQSNHAQGVSTLSDLIGERKRLRGFSYADLEARAQSVITRQRWQQLGTGVRIKEFPEPATLEAMAEALDVDVAEVVLAAARSIGLNVKRGAQSDLAARLPSTADRLSEQQRDAIVTLVRSITEATHADNTTAPSTAPQSGTQGTENQEARWEDDAPFRIVEMLSGPDKGQTFVVSASDFADGPPDQAKYRVLQVMDHLPRSTGKSKKQEADAEGSSQSSGDELAKRRPPNPPDDAPPTDLADVDAARIEPGHVKQGDRVKHNDEVDQVDDEAGEESQDDDSGDL